MANPQPDYEIPTKRQQDLIDALEEYITFLDKHISDLSGFTHAHGMRFSKKDIDEGIRLREKIKSLK